MVVESTKRHEVFHKNKSLLPLRIGIVVFARLIGEGTGCATNNKARRG